MYQKVKKYPIDSSVEWKQVSDYPSYLVSVDGRVWSKHYDREISCTGDKNGYTRVTLVNSLGPKTFKVHRLVLSIFKPIPNFEEMQVNHINGIKTDNSIDNLEWSTVQENIRHAINSKLRGVTKSHGKKFMSPEDLEYIFQARLKNIRIKEIAEKLNFKSNTISSVLIGCNYKLEFRGRREILKLKGLVK